MGILFYRETEEQYVGMVLDTFEDNGYHDSYFFALVWDDEKGETRKVEYGATAYHGCGRVTVDATPETLGKALKWYRDAWIVKATEAAHADVNKPRHGAMVRSVTTRGKDVGVTGEVRWTGDGRYGPRIGIRVEGRKGYVFMSADRVEVIDPAPVDEQEIRDHAVNINPGWKAVARVAA